MPAHLTKAHPALDKAVDTAYAQDGGSARYANDADRMAFYVQALCGINQLGLGCLFSKASLASSKDVLNDAAKSLLAKIKFSMRTTINLDDDLLACASMFTGITDRTPLIRESLKAIIARESARRLALLGGGGSMPELQLTPRRRPEPELSTEPDAKV